jgi:hypothetical protein
MILSDSRWGFGLEIRYIFHFNARLVTALNYSAIADLQLSSLWPSARTTVENRVSKSNSTVAAGTCLFAIVAYKRLYTLQYTYY